MDDQNELEDLIASYALGSLDDNEVAQVEALLKKSQVARDELASFQQIAEMLAVSTPEMEPSDSFEDRLFARINPSQEAAPAAVAQKTADHNRPTVVQPPTFWERVSTFFAQPRLQMASGFAMMFLLFGSGFLMMQNSRMNEELASFENVLPTLELSAVGNSDATGLVVLSSDGADGTLVIDGMAKPAGDQEYQLWLFKDGVIEAGPTIKNLNEVGYGSRWVESLQPLDSYDQFVITLEPEGGSESPTGNPVLQWLVNG